jgi:hypothetical protein
MKTSRILEALLGWFSSRPDRATRRRRPAQARAERLTTPAAERLEQRCLLAADVSGWFLTNGQAAQVLQLDGVVTFINENGGVSEGFFSTPSQLTATGWGGLAGNIVGNEIQWTNGSIWSHVPDLTMTGTINGSSPVLVQQLGIDLILTNEHGGMSNAHFVNSTQFVATDWGNLVGTLVTNTIQWDNGSVWTASDLSVGAPANVSGAWEFGGQNTTILQFGTTLVFVNEHGGASQGTLVDSTHVVATGWGNLTGTIDPATRRIVWANASVWDRVPVLDRNENWHFSSGLPTAISQLGVRIVFTNEHGARSEGLFDPLTGVFSNGWSLNGQIDFVNGRIVWSNASVWTKSAFGDRDAVFTDVNNWPWLA